MTLTYERSGSMHAEKSTRRGQRRLLAGAPVDLGARPVRCAQASGVAQAATSADVRDPSTPPDHAAYLALSQAFQRGTLSATERNVVLLIVSRQDECRYCVAVHSAVADMQRDDPGLIGAIRDGEPIGDERLGALRNHTAALVAGNGHADAFLEAGFRADQILEELVGIRMRLGDVFRVVAQRLRGTMARPSVTIQALTL